MQHLIQNLKHTELRFNHWSPLAYPMEQVILHRNAMWVQAIRHWSIQCETIVIGDVPSMSTRCSVLIILSTTAPSLLPVCSACIRPVVFLVPFVHYYSWFITPLSINSLVRRGKRKQSLLSCRLRYFKISRRICVILESSYNIHILKNVMYWANFL